LNTSGLDVTMPFWLPQKKLKNKKLAPQNKIKINENFVRAQYPGCEQRYNRRWKQK